MKRAFTILLATVLAFSVLTSCTKSKIYAIGYVTEDYTVSVPADGTVVYNNFLIDCKAAVIDMQKSWINNCSSDDVAKSQFNIAMSKIETVFTTYQALIDECKDTGYIDYTRTFDLLTEGQSEPLAQKSFTLSYDNLDK